MNLSTEKNNIEIYVFDSEKKIIMGFEYFGPETKIMEVMPGIKQGLTEKQMQELRGYIILNKDLQQVIGGSSDVKEENLQQIFFELEKYTNTEGGYRMLKLTLMDEFLERTPEEIELAKKEEEEFLANATKEEKERNEMHNQNILQNLKKMMEEASNEEDFEKAVKIREAMKNKKK